MDKRERERERDRERERKREKKLTFTSLESTQIGVRVRPDRARNQ